jgi:hypothetical protein
MGEARTQKTVGRVDGRPSLKIRESALKWAMAHGQLIEVNTKEGCPVTYLRFSTKEYEAIAAACSSVLLSDDLFPAFRDFLFEALIGPFPDLARRIARFRTYQLGILFEYLKRQHTTSGRHPGPGHKA